MCRGVKIWKRKHRIRKIQNLQERKYSPRLDKRFGVFKAVALRDCAEGGPLHILSQSWVVCVFYFRLTQSRLQTFSVFFCVHILKFVDEAEESSSLSKKFNLSKLPPAAHYRTKKEVFDFFYYDYDYSLLRFSPQRRSLSWTLVLRLWLRERMRWIFSRSY